MPMHIDTNDPRYLHAADEILRRHDSFQPEANITSAVRDFLILTGLARSEEMVEENPPSDGSRRAVDLKALDTFIEFKRRIGTASGGAPNPQYVEQLDDYLAQSAKQGRVRMGVLTDGKHWLLRWPGAGKPRLTRPYAFTVDGPDAWLPLFEWLRDSALVSLEGVSPDREGITGHFGPEQPLLPARHRRPHEPSTKRTRSWRPSGSSGGCGMTCCAPPWERSPTPRRG